MKIERYVAQDTKTAMARVRAELGPDALILANRRIGNRVELTAAVDVDEWVDEQSNTPVYTAGISQSAARNSQEPVNEIQLKALERELTRLRGLLESELGDRQWRDSQERRAPLVALRQRLLRLGLSRSLAGSLIDELRAPKAGLESLWTEALTRLTARIQQFDEVPRRSAVFALFGSTGVGKTSTIAKLAGRDVQRFGSEQVGLITLDNYRIGAREQLNSFGDAIGVPVLPADDRHSLALALKELRGRRVYIDTAGMGQHDPRLKRQLAVVSGQREAVHKLLVLPASTQASQLRAMTSVFAPPTISGAIITKLDEALNLGGVIDVLTQCKLPLHSLADGQRVPENIRLGKPDALVKRAVDLMRQDEHHAAESLARAAAKQRPRSAAAKSAQRSSLRQSA